MPSTTSGSMPCASRTKPSRAFDPRVEIGLDDEDACPARRRGDGIDEDQRVVALEQLVGEVHAADAEVGDRDAGAAALARAAGAPPRRRSRRRRGRCCRRRRPGSCGSSRRLQRLDLVGCEVEVAAVPLVQLGGGIVLERDREVAAGPRRRRTRPRRVATRPARNMSCASARRAPGRSRTRLPLATATPPTSTRSVSGDTEASAAGSHHGAAAGRCRPPARLPARRADSGSRRAGGRASPAAWLSTRSMIAAARGSVARASRFSSSVSVMRAQREDLVDLGGVAEIAGALGRDLRVVVEDDRRGEHDVARAGLADEHRPGAHVGAGAPRRRGPLRRIEQRDERAAADSEQGVQRRRNDAAHRFVARRAGVRPRRGFSTRTRA